MPNQLPRARVSRSLRGALRQRQRRHPLEQRIGSTSPPSASASTSGFEEIDDGIWNVYFGPLKLGRLLERHMKIEDAYGRLKRTISNKCNLCLRTILLPMSPTAHAARTRKAE